MKKVMVLLAAFMLLGSVGAFAGKVSKTSSLIKTQNKMSNKLIKGRAFLLKSYSILTDCGETWECNNCPTYTPAQYIVVVAILNSLCDYPDIDEITILF